MQTYQDKTSEQQDKMRENSRRYYNNNKEKSALRAKEWRLSHLDYIREKQRLDKRKRKVWAIDYLGGICMSCEQTFHPSVYEFHHLDPKEKDRDPSKMLQLSLDVLTNELDKCILLCANCHHITHNGYTL